jgi:hypothetical protein
MILDEKELDRRDHILENGLDTCTCKRVNCERHGKCEACIEHHKTKRYEPFCKRKRKEKTKRMKSQV